MLTLITITAGFTAGFTAGYTVRGLLAVALERKRRRQPQTGPPTIIAQPGRGNSQHDVWVVAQVRSWGDDGMPLDWELGGVFSAPEKADQACHRPDDGYWRVETDQFLGEKTTPAPAVFPRR